MRFLPYHPRLFCYNKNMIYYIGNTLSIIDDVEKCTLKDAYKYLKKQKVLGLDIETTKKYNLYPGEGLDPYTSEIVMVQIGDEENQYIIDFRHTQKLGKISKLLESEKYVKVGHNLKFEYKHLAQKLGIRITNLYDTMIVDQILFNGKLGIKYSLAALTKRYLKKELDKTVRLNFLTIGSRPFTKSEIHYGADDIITPLEIKKLQLARIQKYALKNCVKLEMSFIPVLGDVELKGMHFNRVKWLNLYKKNVENSVLQKEKLDEFVIKYAPVSFIEQQIDMFDSTTKSNINWNSSKQVIELLKIFGVAPTEKSKFTGKIAYTVNAAVLKSFMQDPKNLISPHIRVFLLNYLRYKEIEQRCSTFGKDFLKYINPITGRIHSNYRQILTTGRISSSKPNLQNIPAEEEFRACFDAEFGYKIINADYSGQEQIILANKSKDKNLLAFYRGKNTDMHSFVASKIYGVDIEEIIKAKNIPKIKRTAKQDVLVEYRQTAKAAGFAINYGGNGHTISKNLGIPESLGENVYKAYFKAFPGLQTYFDSVKTNTLRRGYILIDKLTRRKLFFNPPQNKQDSNKIGRLAQNAPIQGEAGSITKLAAVMFRRKLIELNLTESIFITNLVHDEINVEAEEGSFSLVAKELLERTMKEAADYWCKIIPLEAKAVITDYWTH